MHFLIVVRGLSEGVRILIALGGASNLHGLGGQREKGGEKPTT